ncbi:hypothetical protein AJ79_03475 [Helicocarpus griseus UAMH5409]|uniref:LysM domain-containing protein n=1 Tax=Helicocarpus griseus UAMH5409 TaxID=1447875 RepID=A0A2B7XX39_9EURO|nr:hypothetical protein AJ79_03475 [Helicocarpus griseus UAMH5409]
MEWNTQVGGAGCTGLWLDAYVCVSVVGHEPTPTEPGNGIETPVPIREGMNENCKEFHFVEVGEICAGIVGRYSISLKNLVAWNPASPQSPYYRANEDVRGGEKEQKTLQESESKGDEKGNKDYKG